MKPSRNIAVLVATLLPAVACQVFAQERTFALERPLQEDFVACMEQGAAENLLQADVQDRGRVLIALPDRCFHFFTTITYNKLVHSHLVGGVTYSVYEGTVRNFSVFVPMKGYVHRVL